MHFGIWLMPGLVFVEAVYTSPAAVFLYKNGADANAPPSPPPLPLSPVHEEEFKQSASAPFIAKTNRQHVAQVGRLVEQTAL